MLKLVIFDLDRTLFDWDETQRLAKKHVNKILQKHIDITTFWKIYNLEHDALWNNFLQKNLTIERYRVERYLKPLQSLGINNKSLAMELNACFVHYALQSNLFCQGAEQALDFCKKMGLRIVLLTNGPKIGQYQKIKYLDLKRWCDTYYVSEEQGIAKPDAQAFLNICQQFKVMPEQCLMVGDDLYFDILPALTLGMKVFWIGGNNKHAEIEQFSLTEFPRHVKTLINPSEI